MNVQTAQIQSQVGLDKIKEKEDSLLPVSHEYGSRKINKKKFFHSGGNNSWKLDRNKSKLTVNMNK